MQRLNVTFAESDIPCRRDLLDFRSQETIIGRIAMPLAKQHEPAPINEADTIAAMLVYLTKEMEEIDPLCVYFLKMCSISLMEARLKAYNNQGEKNIC
jgi:hypothetical protein